MDTVTVNIEGLKEIKKALKVFPEKVQKNILTAGVRAVASDMSRNAKKLVPKDSGDLKKSIQSVKRKSRSKNYVRFTVGINAKKHDVYYGHMIEFGTKDIPAQPFMRPTFEQNKNSAIQQMTAKMRSRIDKEILKAKA